MQNLELASYVYTKYSSLVGSEQIATKLALRTIAEHIDFTNPKSVLEIGSGIGTITELLTRKIPEAKIYCYEVNEWCLIQLQKNVISPNIVIIKSENELKLIHDKIDFIIFDDYINFENTLDLIQKTKPESIFIEGYRRSQRLYVMKSYKKIGWTFRFQNIRKSSDSIKGGCLITRQPSNICEQLFLLGFIRMTLLYSKVLEIRSRISIRKILGKVS
jgi:hypothetical protein